jgi:hypothetical protein
MYGKHLPRHSLHFSGTHFCECLKDLTTPAVVMMQSTQDRHGEIFATCVIWWKRHNPWFRYLLPDPLMRPGMVEVEHIRVKDALELLLMQEEQVIEAFTTHTSQKAFV